MSRDAVVRRQVDQLDASGVKKWAGADEETIGALARKSRERRIDLGARVGIEHLGLQAHGAGCRFCVSRRCLGDPCIVRLQYERPRVPARAKVPAAWRSTHPPTN